MSVSSNISLLGNILKNDNGSGLVKITVPTEDGGKNETVTGLLVGNVSIGLGNNWKPVLPGIDALTAASQVIGVSNDILSWISATQAAWTGSEPLRVNITFYLFSWNAQCNIKEDALRLMKLAVPYKVSDYSVKIHGGYTPDILWNDPTDKSTGTKSGSGSAFGQGKGAGLVSVNISNTIKLNNMLVETPIPEISSLVVKNGNPLYIKMSVDFRSFRVLYTDEIAAIFGLS